VVNRRVGSVERRVFDTTFPSGGRPPYHPKMLTKIVIFANAQRLYSSRQIAKAIRENISSMRIAGCQTPDFRTIPP